MLNDCCSPSVLTKHVACLIISLSSKVVEVKCKLFQSEFDLVSYCLSRGTGITKHKNSKNSFRIIPDWSRNIMTRGSCYLLATSVHSSAQTVKNFVAQISWVSFCWIHFPTAAIRSFWILGERYCAFFRPAEKWSFNTLSPHSIRNWRSAWKLPGLIAT